MTRFPLLQLLPGIVRQYVRGARALRGLGPVVTVFGSARLCEGHPYYELGREVGRQLALRGFTVLTGGGPGLMEAANRGAKEAGGRTAGCNITLPFEQTPNPYLDRVVSFETFSVRKTMLLHSSLACLVLPGGTGTLDELTEALVLIQTGKLSRRPIVLIGTDYWRGFTDWIHSTLEGQGVVTRAELDFLKTTDDPGEAAEIAAEAAARAGVKLKKGVAGH